MKAAAIALALQGATGLVAPRLTVKSSALNAATLEASPSVAHSYPCKRYRRAPPAGSKTSRQRYRCTSSPAEQQSLAKNASHTHMRRGRRRRTPGCKKA